MIFMCMFEMLVRFFKNSHFTFLVNAESNIFSRFSCPSGLPILPNLLRYQWLEVSYYVCAIDASHIRQVSEPARLRN